eukprot:3650459-Ditylum_brightwellii.AAC.1
MKIYLEYSKWIFELHRCSTTLVTVGKLQPVKVLASQLFYNFKELARPYEDFPDNMNGQEIDAIPDSDSSVLHQGDDNLHVVSLPSAIPVFYKDGLQSGKTNMHQLEQMKDYHPIMGL